MLLPTSCPACGRPGPAPCAICIAQMRRAPPVPVPAGCIGCRALLAYEGPARELVARLKYRNARGSLDWLASGLAGLVWSADEPTAVSWAPTTAVRRRERGFDQAELLARRLARVLGLPCPALLQRLPGPPQTGRSHVDRQVGPAFAPVRGRSPPGTVLLVDDVVTTGATLAAASTALGQAGIGPVIALAAAFTSAQRSNHVAN